MWVHIGLLIVLMSFYVDAQKDTGLSCYVCQGVSSFRGCKTSTCPAGDKHCYYEERTSFGQLRIYGGCAADIVYQHTCPNGKGVHVTFGRQKVCKACCDTNLCNAETCSVLGILHHHTTPQPVMTHVPTGPICFSCTDALSLMDCNQVTICQIGEHCSMEIYDAGSNNLRYHGGCAATQKCTSNNFPVRSGHRICTSCCELDYCNSEVCEEKVKEYRISLLGGTNRRQCIQCYDQKLEEVGRCYQKVECTYSSSQCTQVLRNESGILTVDMDCEENLPCTSTVDTDHDVCDICCNWDFCNREVDCRYPVTMTTRHTAGITTTPLPQSTANATPRQCYQCSDVRIDSKGNRQPCYNIVSCAKPTSRCSTAYSFENGITTVNMDCEENLPCTQHLISPDICSSCCDSDLCNQDLDCKRKITASTMQPRNYTGVECEVCSGPGCGVDSTRAVSVRCNNTSPYCLSIVFNDVNGDKHVTKRCGSVPECESKWQQKSSRFGDCLNFDPSNIYSHSFECTYCCVTDNCNRNIRPHNVTLYNPGVYTP